MSAGRRVKRQARRNATVFQHGKTLFVLHEVPDDAPAEIKNALARRNEASTAGRCACGARVTYVRTGGVTIGRYEHEHGCSASDDGLRELYERHNWPGGAA